MSWARSIPLKCCLLNAENLFLLFDQKPHKNLTQYDEIQWQKLSNSIYENKPLKKCFELQKALNEIQADIILLCEVGGSESLSNFNEYFLDKKYSPALIEGNSDRNIDVGFLVKKDLNFYYDLLSNKHRPINYLYPHERQSADTGYPMKITSHKLSRDCVELRLFERDREKPFLIFLLTHLKSRLDPERKDPGGQERRSAELKTVIEIYSELVKKYPQTPVSLCGDFNGDASKQTPDQEFKLIYDSTDLEDVLELSQIKKENRSTFFQIRNAGRSDGKQIDYCFINEPLKKFLKKEACHVYRYKDEFGFNIDFPGTLDAKLQLPSDHYPVVFEFEQLPCW